MLTLIQRWLYLTKLMHKVKQQVCQNLHGLMIFTIVQLSYMPKIFHTDITVMVLFIVVNLMVQCGICDLLMSPDVTQAAVACVVAGDATYYWTLNYQ